jgi:hypothetical protein
MPVSNMDTAVRAQLGTRSHKAGKGGAAPLLFTPICCAVHIAGARASPGAPP